MCWGYLRTDTQARKRQYLCSCLLIRSKAQCIMQLCGQPDCLSLKLPEGEAHVSCVFVFPSCLGQYLVQSRHSAMEFDFLSLCFCSLIVLGQSSLSNYTPSACSTPPFLGLSLPFKKTFFLRDLAHKKVLNQCLSLSLVNPLITQLLRDVPPLNSQ